MLTKKTFFTVIGTVITVVILLNILFWFFKVRFDFTADKAYTLSEPTINILNELKQPVTVTAWISEDLPPDLNKTKDDFEDLLAEYESAAGANFIYKTENPKDGAKAEQEGISPLLLDIREKDQVKQQKIYFGAVVKFGTQSEVIPVVQPGTSMEFSLTTKIKKMAALKKSTVGYLQGHGEPSMQEVAQLMQELSITMEVVPVDLHDTLNIPEEVKTILIVAPKDTIPDEHLQLLDKFLKNGGRIFAAVNRIDINMQTQEVEEVKTGLEDFLKTKGISIIPDVVHDKSCATITVQQQQGGMIFQTPIKLPDIPIITSFAAIPPLAGLDGVTLMFPSSIDTIPGSGFKFTVLAATSSGSGLNILPYRIDLQREWSEADFPVAHIPVSVLAEANRDNNGAKIAVISDGDFIVNGQGQNAQQIQEDNISFVVNMVDFFTDNSGLAALRNKKVTTRPIDPNLGDDSKFIIKYLNFFAPIILAVLFGFWRYSRRKSVIAELEKEDWSGKSQPGGKIIERPSSRGSGSRGPTNRGLDKEEGDENSDTENLSGKNEKENE